MTNLTYGSTGTSYAPPEMTAGHLGQSRGASSTRAALRPEGRRDASVWSMAVTWLVLIPLLYLTMGAHLIPDTSDVSLRVTNTEEGGASHRVPLMFVLFICCSLIFTYRSKIFAMCQRMKLMIAVPLLAMLSFLWSDIPGHTLLSGTIILVFACFAFYVSARYTTSQQLELLALTGAISVTLSLIAAAVAPSTFASPLGWYGIFEHKQNCAAMGTFFLITLVHWKPPSNLYHVLRLFVMALCFLFVGMSQSRTGWGLCAVGLGLSACLGLWQKMRGKEAVAVLLLVVPFVLGISYVLYAYSGELLHSIGKDPTLNQRTIIWSAAVDSIKEHLILGYAYAGFWRGLEAPSLNIILIANWQLWQAQDGYLDLWLQLGAIGEAILALTIVQAVRNMTRCFRRSADSVFVRWCIVVIVCCLLYDIGETSLFIQRMPWFLFMLACIGLSNAARESANETSPLGLPTLREVPTSRSLVWSR